MCTVFTLAWMIMTASLPANFYYYARIIRFWWAVNHFLCSSCTAHLFALSSSSSLLSFEQFLLLFCLVFLFLLKERYYMVCTNRPYCLHQSILSIEHTLNVLCALFPNKSVWHLCVKNTAETISWNARTETEQHWPKNNEIRYVTRQSSAALRCGSASSSIPCRYIWT